MISKEYIKLVVTQVTCVKQGFNVTFVLSLERPVRIDWQCCVEVARAVASAYLAQCTVSSGSVDSVGGGSDCCECC